MNSSIAARLLALNRQFYQTFALQFSATRMRLQPGVRRILEAMPGEADILDLGCGNGELARELARRSYRGRYVGLDFSSELLAEARKNLPHERKFSFLQTDLASPNWDSAPQDLLSLQSGFQPRLVLAFAVLHHLPGNDLRRRVVKRARDLLSPQGQFIHSEWQFLNSPRLSARLQPWEKAGLTAADVDPGDYLLDWRQGGFGLRYVHHFNENELAELASDTGFSIRETFYSDGEGGNLGLYQVWDTENRV